MSFWQIKETRGIPDSVVVEACVALGPSFERDGVPLGDRSAIIWHTPDPAAEPARGYLFLTPEARSRLVSPEMIFVQDDTLELRAYALAPAGYIASDGPNRLDAFVLVPKRGGAS